MKIVIPGGSGQVGSILCRSLSADGHEVVVLSRRPPGGKSQPACRFALWDGKTLGPWAEEIDGADVVINLAGRSVNCRYYAKNRRQIMDSRVDSTRVVGQAIAEAARPPRVWLQMSTATIYAHRYDGANDERAGIIGGHEADAPDTWNFSIDVAQAWEREALAGDTPATRKVLMRSAIVMSTESGGPFDILLRLVRFGLGGAQGDGAQFVSWVHELDFIRAVNWLIDHEDFSGPINIAAPHPLPNAKFMRTLREAWGARFGLPAPAWMLELGAMLLRTETELVLKSRRVVPGRLVESGFAFEYPTWNVAAKELVNQWRAGVRKYDGLPRPSNEKDRAVRRPWKAVVQ